MNRRRAMLLFSLCVAAGFPWRSSGDVEDPPVTSHCVGPRVGVGDETLALRGHLETPPGGDLPVASQVAGRLVSIAVHEGQRIASGDTIATVDDASSRDALTEAQAAVAQAQAGEANSKATLERTRALVARGIAAKQELDDAIAKDQAAHAQVSASAAAAAVARRTLGRVLVRSSFDGVVTRVWRGPGALVDGTAATPIVQLATSGALDFVAEATERELSRLAVDDPARASMVSGEELEGTVRVKATAIDSATGLGAVRITITKSAPGLVIGTFGRAVVILAHRDAVPLLPASALRGAVADGAEVAVCKDGKAALRSLKVGFRDDARFEPLEGLEAGDRVAIDHVLGLADGTPIVEAK